MCAGTPDRYSKTELQCSDNSSLVEFKQLQRTEIDCMMEELRKENWDNSQHCLRSVLRKILHPTQSPYSRSEIRSESQVKTLNN